MKIKKIFTLLFWLWILLIFIFSSIPGSSTPGFPAGTDKIVHFLEYAILGFLAIKSCKFNSKTIWLPGLFTPVLDELYQSLTPGRMSDPYDVLADMMGYFIVLLVYRIYREKVEK
ncbi:MAG: VanZ family protein [Leptospirales bacterium]